MIDTLYNNAIIHPMSNEGEPGITVGKRIPLTRFSIVRTDVVNWLNKGAEILLDEHLGGVSQSTTQNTDEHRRLKEVEIRRSLDALPARKF
jgi:hypothetical protein